MSTPATFRLISQARGGAAIALIEIIGDIDAALAALRIKPVRVGSAPLRDLCGVDQGVVMRVSASEAVVTPHAGPAVVKKLIEAMRTAGLVDATSDAQHVGKGVDDVESITRVMLGILPTAASPAAVDILLDQPRRWKTLLDELGVERLSDVPGVELRARVSPHGELLRRLIDPVTVAAWGRPNIGKSTLLNALAKRSVSMVADAAGTTRDHVGVLLDLGGVVVRYVDTPGIDERVEIREGVSEIDREAQRLAREVAVDAPVLMLCADAGAAAAGGGQDHFLEPPERAGVGGQGVVRVFLRADIEGGVGVGPVAEWGERGGRVSAKTGQGLAELVASIRECVVSEAALTDQRPWAFWEE